MRSAIVPCGTTSSLIFPALYNSSKAGGVGRGKEQISFATRPAANNLGKPEDPKPALFETIVRSRAPCASNPSSNSCGCPTTPKPPSRTTEPSFTSAKASAMVATRLSIKYPLPDPPTLTLGGSTLPQGGGSDQVFASRERCDKQNKV